MKEMDREEKEKTVKEKEEGVEIYISMLICNFPENPCLGQAYILICFAALNFPSQFLL